jgi:hypothetical protein
LGLGESFGLVYRTVSDVDVINRNCRLPQNNSADKAFYISYLTDLSMWLTLLYVQYIDQIKDYTVERSALLQVFLHCVDQHRRPNNPPAA